MADGFGYTSDNLEMTQEFDGPLRLVHLHNLMAAVERQGFSRNAVVNIDLKDRVGVGHNTLAVTIKEQDNG